MKNLFLFLTLALTLPSYGQIRTITFEESNAFEANETFSFPAKKNQ